MELPSKLEENVNDQKIELSNSKMSVAPEENIKIQLTYEQRLLLEDQLRKFVQLITQSYLLSFGISQLEFINESSKNILTELNQVLSEKSALEVYNLNDALDIINGFEKKKEKICVKSYSPARKIAACIPFRVKKTMSCSKVFMHPELLPPSGFRTNVQTLKKNFTEAEDNLIAIGLERFSSSPTPYHDIHDSLLPCKTPVQIKLRVKNVKAKGSPDNPIKVYFKNKIVPQAPKLAKMFDPNYIKPPMYHSKEDVPNWMVPYLKNEQMNEIKKSRSSECISAPTSKYRLLLPQVSSLIVLPCVLPLVKDSISPEASQPVQEVSSSAIQSVKIVIPSFLQSGQNVYKPIPILPKATVNDKATINDSEVKKREQVKDKDCKVKILDENAHVYTQSKNEIEKKIEMKTVVESPINFAKENDDVDLVNTEVASSNKRKNTEVIMPGEEKLANECNAKHSMYQKSLKSVDFIPDPSGEENGIIIKSEVTHEIDDCNEITQNQSCLKEGIKSELSNVKFTSSSELSGKLCNVYIKQEKCDDFETEASDCMPSENINKCSSSNESKFLSRFNNPIQNTDNHSLSMNNYKIFNIGQTAVFCKTSSKDLPPVNNELDQSSDTASISVKRSTVQVNRKRKKSKKGYKKTKSQNKKSVKNNCVANCKTVSKSKFKHRQDISFENKSKFTMNLRRANSHKLSAKPSDDLGSLLITENKKVTDAKEDIAHLNVENSAVIIKSEFVEENHESSLQDIWLIDCETAKVSEISSAFERSKAPAMDFKSVIKKENIDAFSEPGTAEDKHSFHATPKTDNGYKINNLSRLLDVRVILHDIGIKKCDICADFIKNNIDKFIQNNASKLITPYSNMTANFFKIHEKFLDIALNRYHAADDSIAKTSQLNSDLKDDCRIVKSEVIENNHDSSLNVCMRDSGVENTSISDSSDLLQTLIMKSKRLLSIICFNRTSSRKRNFNKTTLKRNLRSCKKANISNEIKKQNCNAGVLITSESAKPFDDLHSLLITENKKVTDAKEDIAHLNEENSVVIKSEFVEENCESSLQDTWLMDCETAKVSEIDAPFERSKAPAMDFKSVIKKENIDAFSESGTAEDKYSFHATPKTDNGYKINNLPRLLDVRVILHDIGIKKCDICNKSDFIKNHVDKFIQSNVSKLITRYTNMTANFFKIHEKSLDIALNRYHAADDSISKTSQLNSDLKDDCRIVKSEIIEDNRDSSLDVCMKDSGVENISIADSSDLLQTLIMKSKRLQSIVCFNKASSCRRNFNKTSSCRRNFNKTSSCRRNFNKTTRKRKLRSREKANISNEIKKQNCNAGVLTTSEFTMNEKKCGAVVELNNDRAVHSLVVEDAGNLVNIVHKSTVRTSKNKKRDRSVEKTQFKRLKKRKDSRAVLDSVVSRNLSFQ